MANAEFKVTTLQGVPVDDNEGQTSTGGVYRTNENGEILLANLQPGTYRVSETKAPSGYVLDSTAKTVTVNANDAQTVTFTDEPLQSIVIQKYIQGTTKPLVTFLVTDGNGAPVGGGSGEYVTDANGRITISGLKPGTTIIAREVRTVKGYTLNGTPQTLVVGSGGSAVLAGVSGSSSGASTVSGSSMTFYDEPMSRLVVHKVIDGTDGEPLQGVTFRVTDGSGAAVGNSGGEYVTDEAGTFTVENLEQGETITVREVKTVSGFVLDSAPKTVKITNSDVYELSFSNRRAGSLTIQSLDSVTREPIPGVEFKVLYADGRPVDTSNGQESSGGQYFTDANGEIHITGIVGTIVVTEEKTANGYTMDANNRRQTVIVSPAETQTLTFKDTPDQALTIQLYAEGTTDPIANAQFLLMAGTGAMLGDENGVFTTDSSGRFTLSGIKPGVIVKLKQTTTADGYLIDGETKTILIKSGNAQTVTVYNAPTQALTVQLYAEETTEPIANAQFLLTDGNDAKLGDDNGTFTTDSSGRFTLMGLKPGVTVKVKQLSTVDGYLIDSETKTITIKSGNAQTVTVYNAPTQALTVQLYVEGTTDPIAGAKFLLTDSTGKKLGTENGVFTTDANGRFTLAGLKPGVTVKVKQTSTADSYLIDSDTHTIAIESGDSQTVTVYNAPKQSFTLRLYAKGTETAHGSW